MSDNGSNHDSLPEQPEENKLKTAFLQVPIEFKDEVQAYLEKLIAASDSAITISNENIDQLPSQGCFLVISLEKIEEIIDGLQSCLSMEPDNGARNIKSQLRRTLTLLS